MITSLKLRNFKRHEAAAFDFRLGLNAITGPNYSGKSTLLHGVLFALFGSSAVPGGSGVVKNRRADKPAYVELDFTSEGRDYHIERSAGKVRLFEGDVLIASSASAVTEKVEELLGMEKKRFLQLRYAEQKRTEQLLTLGAGELHSVIEEVSGADIVNFVIDRAGDIEKEARGGLETLPDVDVESLRGDEATLTAAIEKAGEDKAELEATLKASTEAHDGAKQALGRAQRQNRRRRELLEQSRELEVERAKADAAATEARQTLADCGEDDLDQAKAALAEIQEQFRKEKWLASRHKELADRERDLDAEARELAGELEELRGKSELDGFHQDDLDARVAERDELRTKVLGLKADVRNAKQSLEDSVCHACGRPLDGAHVEEIEQDKVEAEAALAKAQPELEALEATIDGLSEQKAAVEKVQRQITKAEVQLEQVQGTLDGTRKAVAELDKPASAEDLRRLKDVTLPEAQTFYDEQVALRDRRQRAEKALTRARDRISLLDKELGELGAVPEEVDEEPLQASLDTAADRLEKDKAAYHDARSELQFAEHRLSEVREKLQAAEKVAEKRRHLEARKAAAGQLVKYLRKNRDRFLMEVWDGVMAYASHFAESCTGGAITSVGRSPDGKFTYVEDGQEMPVEAGSGAQRSLMGLGVQMALAQMLPSPFDGVLLDEPTADMDEERSMAMAMMLGTANGQVLMVSHREFDGSVATHAIHLGEAA